MKRLRGNFLGGQLDVVLDVAGGTMSSPSLSRLPVITDGVNYMPISINPDGENDVDPEIVWVTAHTSGSTLANVARGKENTTAQTWPVNTYWQHAPTVEDYTFIINTDGDPGTKIYIGSVDPATAGYTLQTGDLWIEV